MFNDDNSDVVHFNHEEGHEMVRLEIMMAWSTFDIVADRLEAMA